MLSPKEKAKELVDKYSIKVKVFYTEDSIPSVLNAGMCMSSVKQCALIAVDEILNINSVDKDYDLSDFWEEVKKEIKKL